MDADGTGVGADGEIDGDGDAARLEIAPAVRRAAVAACPQPARAAKKSTALTTRAGHRVLAKRARMPVDTVRRYGRPYPWG